MWRKLRAVHRRHGKRRSARAANVTVSGFAALAANIAITMLMAGARLAVSVYTRVMMW
jgi:hypothetical protein